MSSFVKIGSTLNVFKENDDSPIVARSEAGDVITRKGNIKASRVKAWSDTLVYGTPDGEYPDAVLTGIQADPVNGGTSEITLTYSPVNASFEVIPPVGTVIQEVDANAIDIPILKNPNLTPSEAQALLNDGVESYIAPQPTYRRTEILSAFSFDVTGGAGSIDEILSTVGRIDSTPEGLTNPTATEWLKVDQTVRAVGDKFEQVEVWQYASDGWDDDIYDVIA